MPKVNCDVPLRGDGREQSVWKIEFTFASGAAVVDKSQSNVDTSFPLAQSAVVSGATVNIKYPKCQRMWILSKNLTPATVTTGTQYRFHEVTNKVPAAVGGGTAVIRFFDTTFAATLPVDGSRYQLILLLDA